LSGLRKILAETVLSINSCVGANKALSSNTAMRCDAIVDIIRRGGPGTYGITGSAGAGKSHTANRLGRELRCSIYSADYAFIGTSEDRKLLLSQKQMRSVEGYKDAANQFNWWDWGAILSDLEDLQARTPVKVSGPYDRSTGNYGADLDIPATDTLLFEGAIFGPPFLLTRLKKIFFLCVDPAVRFQRLAKKDRDRRAFNEIVARFLVTEYSETLYYRLMFEWAERKIIFIDGLTGLPCGKPVFPSDLFIPLHVTVPSRES